MRIFVAPILMAAAAIAPAQMFDPAMPATVPAVTGPAAELYGLRYIDVKLGDGAPALGGQEYTVHYTGWLRNGTQFDSSVGKSPLPFIQGRRMVISGWDSGFEGMKVGGKRRLFIPYQLAYGEAGRPPQIPPKSELVFDVELLGVKDVGTAPTPGADLTMVLHDLEDHVLALAKAVPEDKYSWRPAAGVRSFQQVFLHMVYGNQLLMNIASNSPTADALKKQVDDNARNEEVPVSKEKLIEMMTQNFAAIHRTLDRARASTLAHPVDFFGTPASTNGVLINLETHLAEHLGQAIAYARMNGIVPPWSK